MSRGHGERLRCCIRKAFGNQVSEFRWTFLKALVESLRVFNQASSVLVRQNQFCGEKEKALVKYPNER